tara:strand:- start:394 stop:1059 length:666 start_codon:yes stop_codon:yes gene_type:complete
MFKNIILQHFNGKLRELDKLSIENIKSYASMIGAEYKLVTGKPLNEKLTDACQKVSMLSVKYDDYDQVLMLDIDMFAPKNMTTNVFKVPGIGMYNTTQQMLHRKILQHGGDMSYPYWGGAIYKMDRETRYILRRQLQHDQEWMFEFNEPYKFEDEGIMHILAKMANFKPEQPYIHNKWCQCSFLPNPEKAGFIHIRTKVTPQGPKREKIENYYDLKMKGII